MPWEASDDSTEGVVTGGGKRMRLEVAALVMGMRNPSPWQRQQSNIANAMQTCTCHRQHPGGYGGGGGHPWDARERWRWVVSAIDPPWALRALERHRAERVGGGRSLLHGGALRGSVGA